MPLGDPGGYGRLGGLRQLVRGEGFAGTGSRVGNPAPSGFTNLEGMLGTALDIGSELPTPGAMVAKAMRAGTKASNAYHMDDVLEGEGFRQGLTFGQQLGAAFGFNSYGTGGPKAMRAARAMAQRRRSGFSGSAPNNPGRPRSQPRNVSPGRRGARDRGGAAESGRMGGADFGDRTSSPGGMGGV